MTTGTRTILTLVLAAAIALFTAGPAAANCTSTTYIVGGKITICSTCCFGGNCTVNCF